MLKNLVEFAVTATVSAGLIVGSMAQAHAAITINGGGENGLGLNGGSLNGVSRNGGGDNGLQLNGWHNGIGLNGGTENGVATGRKGFAIDGIELPTAR